MTTTLADYDQPTGLRLSDTHGRSRVAYITTTLADYDQPMWLCLSDTTRLSTLTNRQIRDVTPEALARTSHSSAQRKAA